MSERGECGDASSGSDAWPYNRHPALHASNCGFLPLGLWVEYLCRLDWADGASQQTCRAKTPGNGTSTEALFPVWGVEIVNVSAATLKRTRDGRLRRTVAHEEMEARSETRSGSHLELLLIFAVLPCFAIMAILAQREAVSEHW